MYQFILNEIATVYKIKQKSPANPQAKQNTSILNILPAEQEVAVHDIVQWITGV